MDREALEKQKAQKRVEDKDLARLAEIRKKREDDAKRREEEKKGKLFSIELFFLMKIS